MYIITLLIVTETVYVCYNVSELRFLSFFHYGSLPVMLSRQNFLTSASITIKLLFLEHYFFTILGIRLFATAYTLLLCPYFQLKTERNFCNKCEELTFWK